MEDMERIETELDMDSIDTNSESKNDEIFFEQSEKEEDNTISLDDTEEKDEKKEEESSEDEEESEIPNVNKGMTEDDYKKWAEQFNCTEQEVIDAIDMGWHGPRNFSKDKVFLTPVEFLEKSKKNAPIMHARLKKIQEESKRNEQMYKAMMQQMVEIQKKNTQDALAAQKIKIEELEKKLKQAKDDFDVEEVEKLSKEKYQMEINQKKSTEKTIISNPNINKELETDWVNNSETAKLIKADPELRIKASQIINMMETAPEYADWTSEDRIAYLERKFGAKKVTKPEFTSVGKPTIGAKSTETTWDSVPYEFKELSLELAKSLPWWSTKTTNEESKKSWENYKKEIINAYKQSKGE